MDWSLEKNIIGDGGSAGVKHKPKPPKKGWGGRWAIALLIPFLMFAGPSGCLQTILGWIPGSPPGIEEVEFTPKQKLAAAEQSFEAITRGLTSVIKAGYIKQRDAAVIKLVKDAANEGLKSWSAALIEADIAAEQGRHLTAAELRVEAGNHEALAIGTIAELTKSLAVADAKQAEDM